MVASLFRCLLILVLLFACFMLLLACGQHRMIYFPRSYHPQVVRGFIDSGGQRIDVETSEGTQTAWLLPAVGGNARKLWIVCGGNATLGLEWSERFGTWRNPSDAVLFFDYPGYGENEGRAHPDTIRESIAHILPAALDAAGIPQEESSSRVLVFGHSLGASVALMFANEAGSNRGILLSPFTSTMDMTRVVFGVRMGWLVRHRFDNLRALAALNPDGAQFFVFHGALDREVPAHMSESLHEAHPDIITLTLVDDAGHNNLHHVAAPKVRDAIHQLAP